MKTLNENNLAEKAYAVLIALESGDISPDTAQAHAKVHGVILKGKKDVREYAKQASVPVPKQTAEFYESK